MKKMGTQFLACLTLLSFCLSAEGSDSVDTVSAVSDIPSSMGKSRQSYANALVFLARRLRPEDDRLMRAAQDYDSSRAEWLRGRERALSAGSTRAHLQTVWPRDLRGPAPSVGLAAWVLSLNSYGYGVVGADRLSWSIIRQSMLRRAVVLAEIDSTYEWVVDTTRSRKGFSVKFSGGRDVWCGKKQHQSVCAPAGLRQWIIIFPYTWQGCALLENTRAQAKTVQATLFWYPRFLEHYLTMLGDGAGGDPLPTVDDRDPCSAENQ